jgi:hypothetical protein
MKTMTMYGLMGKRIQMTKLGWTGKRMQTMMMTKCGYKTIRPRYDSKKQ